MGFGVETRFAIGLVDATLLAVQSVRQLFVGKGLSLAVTIQCAR